MQATSSPLVQRMIGAARLDPATYEEVENDRDATTQALIVVAIAAVAGAIGGLRDGGEGLIAGLLATILLWAIFAAVAYFVGTKVIPAPETRADIGEVLRTTGFAYAPQVLGVVGFIPILGPIVSLIATIWFLIASIVGLRHALDMSTGRTIAVALISIIPAAIVAGIIITILT